MWRTLKIRPELHCHSLSFWMFALILLGQQRWWSMPIFEGSNEIWLKLWKPIFSFFLYSGCVLTIALGEITKMTEIRPWQFCYSILALVPPRHTFFLLLLQFPSVSPSISFLHYSLPSSNLQRFFLGFFSLYFYTLQFFSPSFCNLN